MAKVRDLLAGSLRLIGVLDPGEAMDAEAARDALQALNELIESLNLEQLVNPRGVAQVDVTTTPSQAVHTIGTGGNFNVTRPVAIDRATVTVNGCDYPVEVVGGDEWSAISIKNLSGIPETLYYDHAYPLGQVHLYPKPDQAYALALWCWDSLPTYASINDTLILPPGYAKMLRYNLALDLASEWGRDLLPAVVQNALESKAAVKRANHVTPLLSVDPAMVPGHGLDSGYSAFLGG